jgi:hypothetical protein
MNFHGVPPSRAASPGASAVHVSSGANPNNRNAIGNPAAKAPTIIKVNAKSGFA